MVGIGDRVGVRDGAGDAGEEEAEHRSLKWSEFLLELLSSISATYLTNDTFGAGLPVRRSAANLIRMRRQSMRQ